MNFVTLTKHSPSHASVIVDAKVKKRNSRTGEIMGVGEVRSERKERGRPGGKKGVRSS